MNRPPNDRAISGPAALACAAWIVIAIAGWWMLGGGPRWNDLAARYPAAAAARGAILYYLSADYRE